MLKDTREMQAAKSDCGKCYRINDAVPQPIIGKEEKKVSNKYEKILNKLLGDKTIRKSKEVIALKVKTGVTLREWQGDVFGQGVWRHMGWL